MNTVSIKWPFSNVLLLPDKNLQSKFFAMTLNEYQENAKTTIQSYNSDDKKHYILGFLGLAGEAGSALTTLKKLLRDGNGFETFKDKLREELGDVLWYISSIASHNGITLEEIAKMNLAKVKDRFDVLDLKNIPRFDETYPEKFPDSFIVEFREVLNASGLLEVSMTWEKANGEIASLGDPLTDNSWEPNEYRYHDVFHLGYIAFLGWSPVFRHLMELKRKSDILTLDAEDRGRPQVAEEAITLLIYNYAKANKMLKESDRLDTELLDMIRQLSVDLEVAAVSSFQWECTILLSYKVFHQLLEARGGKVLVSPSRRELIYLGK